MIRTLRVLLAGTFLLLGSCSTTAAQEPPQPGPVRPSDAGSGETPRDAEGRNELIRALNPRHVQRPEWRPSEEQMKRVREEVARRIQASEDPEDSATPTIDPSIAQAMYDKSVLRLCAELERLEYNLQAPHASDGNDKADRATSVVVALGRLRAKSAAPLLVRLLCQLRPSKKDRAQLVHACRDALIEIGMPSLPHLAGLLEDPEMRAQAMAAVVGILGHEIAKTGIRDKGLFPKLSESTRAGLLEALDVWSEDQDGTTRK